MPENYYCLDNFFHKVTDMESPRKNNDCYFYYYSTCTKGDNCTFRHEPSALGCETTCQFWKEGKCINVRCQFRHMELRKNRKVIPCYWETQPGGCLKPHCPFLHQNPKNTYNLENQGESSEIKRPQDIKPAIQNSDSCAKNLNHSNEKNFGNSVVDPLVVNFEEESDNESAPTQSPIKTSYSVKVKTLEEIRLEKIQAESAAFYSYPESEMEITESDDLRSRIAKRFYNKFDDQKASPAVLSLNEIRKRKRIPMASLDTSDETIGKKQRITLKLRKESNINDVKIKTLEEIRAERAKRLAADVSSTIEAKMDIGDFCEVSSTSKPDIENDDKSKVCSKLPEKNVVKIQPIKRLKRRRDSEEDINSKVPKLETYEEVTDGNSGDVKLYNEENKVEEFVSTCEQLKSVSEQSEICDQNISAQKLDEGKKADFSSDLLLSTHLDNIPETKDNVCLESSKLDDVLLLDEEEFEGDTATKAEEDILKDIDELLNE